jgi:YD repeat-containing protein
METVIMHQPNNASKGRAKMNITKPKKEWLNPLWLSVILFLLHGSASAAPGITSDNAKPHFSSFKNQETFEDMRVKVLGGHVRMTRIWEGEKWSWNTRWGDLGAGENTPIHEAQLKWINGENSSTTVSPVDAWIANPPLIIYRAGQVYRRVSIKEDGIRYENQLEHFIHRHDNGYTWTDTKGNAIEYDIYGRISNYSDKNGIYVYIERDRHGYISHIKDHHKNVVISYAWETIPGTQLKKNVHGETFQPKRLTSLTDYTGRAVTYHWNESNRLTEITDVLGSSWKFGYKNNGELTQLIDPEGRITRYVIELSGKFISKSNHDKIGVSYTYSYDKDSEEYYVSEKDSSGKVSEKWHNAMGHVVNSSINGEQQEKTVITLSDNSLGVDIMVGN